MVCRLQSATSAGIGNWRRNREGTIRSSAVQDPAGQPVDGKFLVATAGDDGHKYDRVRIKLYRRLRARRLWQSRFGFPKEDPNVYLNFLSRPQMGSNAQGSWAISRHFKLDFIPYGVDPKHRSNSASSSLFQPNCARSDYRLD